MAVTLLLAQAAAFNKQRFKQGQATFHRVQDVETLVVDVKSALASFKHVLNKLVPTTIQSVLEQSIPPTLRTILGDTISPTLCNVLDGTFSEFTSRFESVGGEVIREVKATLESQQAAIATDYASVRSSLQEVLAWLGTLDKVGNSLPPDHPGYGGAGDLNRSHSPHSECGGDRDPNVSSPHVWCGMEGPTPLAANMDPSSPSAGPSDPRESSMPSFGCPPYWGWEFLAGQAACQRQHGYNDDQIHVDTQAAHQRQHGYNNNQLHVDTHTRKVQGGKIVSPRSADHAWYARKQNKSHFDLAGLTSVEYHLDEDSVDLLTEKIIHNCGYKSIHVDHPEDILLCFNEIILIHKIVVQGWRNPWMQFIYIRKSAHGFSTSSQSGCCWCCKILQRAPEDFHALPAPTDAFWFGLLGIWFWGIMSPWFGYHQVCCNIICMDRCVASDPTIIVCRRQIRHLLC